MRILSAIGLLFCLEIFSNEAALRAMIRLFRASGQHTCWSSKAIGHKCTVNGTGYTSCDDAFRALQGMDCCPMTNEGGSSVDFRINTCTAF